MKRISKSAKNADKEILKLHTKERKANRVRFGQRSSFIVCAAGGGMTESVRRIYKMSKDAI